MTIPHEIRHDVANPNSVVGPGLRRDDDADEAVFRARRLWIMGSLAMMITTPAFAHPGEHGRMGTIALLHHLAEPFHLVLALAAVAVVGVLIWSRGRLIVARSRPRAPHDKDRQP